GGGAARLAAGLRPYDLPEHGVVGVAAAVVDDRLADVLRHAVDVAEDLDGRLVLQVRGAFEGLVEVVDVGLVVPAVVDLHRHRVDVRLQGVRRVGQRRKGVRHGVILLIGIRLASPTLYAPAERDGKEDAARTGRSGVWTGPPGPLVRSTPLSRQRRRPSPAAW